MSVSLTTIPQANYGALFSAAKVEAMTQHVVTAGETFGFDIETGYTGKARAKVSLRNNHPDWLLAGWSFTNSDTWARYVPVLHDDGNNVDDPLLAGRALWQMLQTGLGVAHNLSFELRCLSRWFEKHLSEDLVVGNEIRRYKGFFPFKSDSMVEAFLTGRYHPLTIGQDLKSLTKAVFNHQMLTIDELKKEYDAKGNKDSLRFNVFPVVDKVVRYACEDSLWCLKLHKLHYPLVTQEYKRVYDIEMKLLPVFIEMEREGMYLDWLEVRKALDGAKALAVRVEEEIQHELSERVGRQVNINLGSPKQLGEILFDELKLPVRMRSEKTGAPSTSEKALHGIAQIDGTVRRILDYRGIEKLISAYLKKYAEELSYAVDPETLTGRAFPSHKSTGAITGRTSVDDVSYQQWPKPYHYELSDGTFYDLNFRNLCICPPEYRGIGFDYSQVELRVLAGVAHEDNMLEAFRKKVDIHKATASMMLGIPLADVTKGIRAVGKTCNFATVYGSGAENMAGMLSTPERPVTTEDAEELLAKYFAAFPNIKKWIDETVRDAKRDGFITNAFGRRVTIWEYTSTERWIYSKGDRLAGNAPIQGAAADYCKLAMVRANIALEKAGLKDKVKMFMMIHDALEFYVHESVPTQEVINVLGPAISYHYDPFPEIEADWHEWTRWGEPVNIKLADDGKIDHYEIEDVDLIFPEVVDAYAYYRGEATGLEVAEAPVEFDLTVTLSAMPRADDWARFKMMLRERPGNGKVTVLTPDGAAELPQTVSLLPVDQPQISQVLSGALVSFTRHS